MDLIALLILLCLDDRDVLYTSRRDAKIVTKMCIDVMRKIGLIVDTETETKESKTKDVFYPSTLTIRR